ncbi:MAG: T9SS type A sorting domain-containing protein [Bacteroidia bacterium]|nr:T9SS type A sorting domain-containing protein [Bacteroidia bacterium]
MSDFWEYDPSVNIWSPKASLISPGRYEAVGFSIGNKGYIGLGYNCTVRIKDFWEYDPGTDTWTQKADFDGGPRAIAFAFSVGSKGYVGAGYGDSCTNGKCADFWEYDSASNLWTQKAGFNGLPRYWAFGFSVGSKGYVTTGMDTVNPNPPYKKDLWEYDTTTDVWVQKADFPGMKRFGASGFSLGTNAYVGLGLDSIGIGYSGDFYRWSQISNTWTPIANFAGTSRFQTVGFSINGKGYIGTGYDGAPSLTSTFWEYTPSSIGINEPSLPMVTLFPNPADDLLMVNSSVVSIRTVEIYNISGAKVHSINISNQPTTIDISFLQGGVYFVETIGSDNKTSVAKLVKR